MDRMTLDQALFQRDGYRPDAPDAQWPRSESHLVDEINDALDAAPETASGEA